MTDDRGCCGGDTPEPPDDPVDPVTYDVAAGADPEAGTSLPILDRTEFQFDGRAGTDQEVPLSTWIPTIDWGSGSVEVRLHAKGSWPSASCTAVVVVESGLPSCDEPGVTFLSAMDLGSVTIANADTAPKVYRMLLDNFGAYARVVLRWAQGASASGAQTFALSVDLVGRPQGIGPRDFPGLALWLRADMGVTLNGSTVSAWADQSGNGFNASQGTAAQQPTFVAADSDIAGRPALSFDGSDDRLTGAISASGDNYTLFAVAKITDSNDWVVGFGSTSAAGDEHLALCSDNSANRFRVQNGSAEQILGSALGSWQVFSAINEEELRRFYEEGTQVGSDNIVRLTLSPLTLYTIGSRIDQVAFLTGRIAEIILYDRRLSDDERKLIERYLMNRYSLA